MADMRRWSDEKLDMELAFARACKDDDHGSHAWWERVYGEYSRRIKAHAIGEGRTMFMWVADQCWGKGSTITSARRAWERQRGGMRKLPEHAQLWAVSPSTTLGGLGQFVRERGDPAPQLLRGSIE